MARLAALVIFAALVMGAVPATASPLDSPGTVVNSAELPRAMWIPGTADATKVTYWSKGPGGQPMLSTGVVYVPEGTAPEGGWPVVSWAHGTVGVGDQCAPSVTGRSQRDLTYLTHWLRQGYAVVASDYVGLGTPGVHPYLDGTSEAYSVIDMVRAARSLEPDLARKWVVIGQSQGGQAAMFTAHAATSYASELDFRGSVGTGVASELEKLLPFAGPYVPPVPFDGTTVFAAFALAGLRASQPDLHIDSYLTPFGVNVIDRVENLCYDGAFDLVKGIGIGRLMAKPLLDPPVVAAIRRMQEVPTSGYDRPIFIGQGVADVVVPAPLTAKLVTDLALNRVDFVFRPYPRGHDQTMADSLPDTTPFVKQLFAG